MGCTQSNGGGDHNGAPESVGVVKGGKVKEGKKNIPESNDISALVSPPDHDRPAIKKGDISWAREIRIQRWLKQYADQNQSSPISRPAKKARSIDGKDGTGMSL
jgi:hypothetical protein